MTGMRFFSLAMVLTLISLGCKEDDSVNCLQCSSETTTPFELCRDSNGNATVNGENTGTDYDVYLSDLEETGVSCGG